MGQLGQVWKAPMALQWMWYHKSIQVVTLCCLLWALVALVCARRSRKFTNEERSAKLYDQATWTTRVRRSVRGSLVTLKVPFVAAAVPPPPPPAAPKELGAAPLAPSKGGVDPATMGAGLSIPEGGAGPTRAARTYQGDSPVAITRVARV